MNHDRIHESDHSSVAPITIDNASLYKKTMGIRCTRYLYLIRIFGQFFTISMCRICDPHTIKSISLTCPT